MASQTRTTPVTADNDASLPADSTISWDPGATAPEASCAIFGAGLIFTRYWKVNVTGWTLPTAATVTSVVVKVNRGYDGTTGQPTGHLYALYYNGAYSGAQQPGGDTWPPDVPEQITVTFSGAALTGITASGINANGIGIGVSAEATDAVLAVGFIAGGEDTPAVEVTVSYTESGGGGSVNAGAALLVAGFC